VSETLAAAGYAVVLGTAGWSAGPLDRTRRLLLVTLGALVVTGSVSVLQLTASSLAVAGSVACCC
jgi:hypothetical protein